jgi:hypothetical protein
VVAYQGLVQAELTFLLSGSWAGMFESVQEHVRPGSGGARGPIQTQWRARVQAAYMELPDIVEAVSDRLGLVVSQREINKALVKQRQLTGVTLMMSKDNKKHFYWPVRVKPPAPSNGGSGSGSTGGGGGGSGSGSNSAAGGSGSGSNGGSGGGGSGSGSKSNSESDEESGIIAGEYEQDWDSDDLDDFE